MKKTETFLKISNTPDGCLIVQKITTFPNGKVVNEGTQLFPKGEAWVEIPAEMQGFPWVLEGIKPSTPSAESCKAE